LGPASPPPTPPPTHNTHPYLNITPSISGPWLIWLLQLAGITTKRRLRRTASLNLCLSVDGS